MKKIAIITLTTLLIYTTLQAQRGKPEIITFTSEDGTVFTVGDTMRFGIGSNTSGNFKYIYVLPNFFNSNALYYNSTLDGKFATIDKMQKSGSDKMGYTMYFTFRYPSGNSAVQVESAIASGELITPASKKKAEEKNKPLIIQGGGAPSLADELKKLKELLDQGILNQAEFDTQKKKLLDGK